MKEGSKIKQTELSFGEAKHMMEKRQSLQQIFLGKQDICMQKTEIRSMYKYQLKVN
jgi:hypothetical protein